MGTKPEKLLQSVLARRGYSFQVNASALPGKPDIVFVRHKIAVFVDGDFWHGRNWSRRKARLRLGHNSTYWIAKIEANIHRDRKVRGLLNQAGWRVLRFWESDIRHHLNFVVREIRKITPQQKNKSK